MQKTLSDVMAVTAGIALAAAVTTATDVRPSDKAVSDLVQSLASGLILGSNVWPYGSNPLPPEAQSKQSVGLADCDRQDRCSMYGLASAAFVDWQPNSARE
jgi:hypothetical protein